MTISPPLRMPSHRRRITSTSSGAPRASTTQRSSGCKSTSPPVLERTRAATSCSQTTRLPGYRNRKYAISPLVTVEYRDAFRRFAPNAFPATPDLGPKIPPPFRGRAAFASASERARRYLTRVEPAVAGQHGDLHTFRVCCRIVRGFGLTDAEAAAVLDDWNSRCDPPWTDRELQDKIASARRYGREPIGALL